MSMFRSWQQLVPRAAFSLVLLASLIVARVEAGTSANAGSLQALGDEAQTRQVAQATSVYLPLVFNTAQPAQPAPPPPPPPPAQPGLRIDAAASSSYTDSNGNEWEADTGFCDGSVGNYGDIPITNTNDPQIYRTERYRVTSCALTVANGDYTVRLHFMEGYYTGAGQRVLDIDVENVLIDNLDVFAEAGGGGIALVKTVDVTVTDGQLDIIFFPEAGEGMLHGIEVLAR